MDPLLLIAYLAVPATITLLAYLGLKLHERSAPPMPELADDLEADTTEPEVSRLLLELAAAAGRRAKAGRLDKSRHTSAAKVDQGSEAGSAG